MSTPPQHRIRMLLQKYHDGLTLQDISNYLNMNYTNAGRSLEKMPDAYIDRWIPKVGKGRGNSLERNMVRYSASRELP